jgi:hypothetical protein
VRIACITILDVVVVDAVEIALPDLRASVSADLAI